MEAVYADQHVYLGAVARQRALAQHVDAGGQGRDCDRGVQVIRRADIDRVDLAAPQQVLEIGVHARDAELARLQKIEDEKNQLLLRAYTTERDLLIARDNKVAAIQGIIDLTSSNNTSLQESLVALEGRAANYERSGKSAPDALMHEMESTQRQIRNNERYITAKQKEMERITASYNNDLERFRKLKNRNYKRKIAQEAQAETKTKK